MPFFINLLTRRDLARRDALPLKVARHVLLRRRGSCLAIFIAVGGRRVKNVDFDSTAARDPAPCSALGTRAFPSVILVEHQCDCHLCLYGSLDVALCELERIRKRTHHRFFTSARLDLALCRPLFSSSHLHFFFLSSEPPTPQLHSSPRAPAPPLPPRPPLPPAAALSTSSLPVSPASRSPTPSASRPRCSTSSASARRRPRQSSATPASTTSARATCPRPSSRRSATRSRSTRPRATSAASTRSTSTA